MLKNYFKIALRNLLRQKGFSFINIAGLATGMACSILILLWVQDELRYDRFHANANAIYRLTAEINADKIAVTSAQLAPALQAEMPAVKNAVRLYPSENLFQAGNRKFEEKRVFYADSTFLQLFSFPLLKGNARTALAGPDGVLLTEETAKKCFGSAEALGQTIRMDNQHDFIVTGVLKSIPANSHLQFDLLLPMAFLARINDDLKNKVWSNFNFYTYIQLHESFIPTNTALGNFEQRITNIYTKNEPGMKAGFRLQPLTKIHLHSKLLGDLEGHGNIQNVRVFSIIAAFILLTACINFMNLATARSARRAKEVGLRKVIGAHRGQLIGQFLSESLLLSFLALGLAVILVKGALPVFNDLSGKALQVSFSDGRIFLGMLFIAVVTGLISGSYPALFLSGFQPVEVLKGGMAKVGRSSVYFRNGLVVLQFVVSIVLIVGTAVVYHQLQFIRSKNLGYDKEVHFNSEGIEGTLGKMGSLTYIYVFSIIALFVLLLACINYMNLTTALFSKRAKEIGVRKMIGASRKTLAGQFLAEAFLTTFISLLFALSLVKLLLPYFNAFTEKQLSLGLTTDYRIWLGTAFIMLLVGALSGIYPALFQSRLNPLVLFKNKIPVGKESISLRQFLVVLQFSVSIVMMVATLVVYRQIKYVSTKDMGFTKSQLLVVDINSGSVRKGAETIKNELAKIPQIKSVTVSSRVPGEWKNLPKVKVNNSDAPVASAHEMFYLGVDDHFLPTYEIELVKGRNFRAGSPADSSAVLLNQTAARELGITEPSEQIIQIPATNFSGSYYPVDKPIRMRVIGIVKDFNFQSLREPLAPMVLAYQKNPIHNIDYFTARVNSANVGETIKQMEAVLHNIDQDHLFEYHFLDSQWDLFYREDKIRETIFLMGAALAIIIGCLGLFGLATFAAEQRTKEIGIRKVLGASIQSVVIMLSKDFLKLVLIAALIAFPVAWYAMHQWLQDFAYRINLGWGIFALAGGLGVLIAFFTVSFQAIRAAVSNPVHALRSE